MLLDVVNDQNEKVDSIELRDDVFGGPVNVSVIWESVVHEQAAARRGTHATKNRALVSGSGRKPWRQKGTGRARVGEIRNPLWRKGGTVFGPQPRGYGYELPRKVGRAAVREALAARMAEGGVVVVTELPETAKTKDVAALLERLGATGRSLLIDTRAAETATRATRNVQGARLVASNAVTARDIIQARRVIVTRAALERLEAALAAGGPTETA